MREIATVWAGEVRRALKSARVLVLLILFGMFSGLSMLLVGSIANAMRAGLDQQLSQNGVSDESAAQALIETRRRILGFLFSEDTKMIEMLVQIPLVILFVFKLTMFFLPAYIALMGFDQISGEVGPKSMRFLTVRARRSSVLLGKFFTQATLLLGLVLVVDLAMFGFARVSDHDFEWAVLIPTFCKFWGAAVLFSLAYLGLTSLCSTLFKTPAVSLVFNFILLFVFWLLNGVGERARLYNQYGKPEGDPPSRWEWIRYLSPSNYSSDLLSPHLRSFSISLAAYAGFSVMFLSIAYLVLRRRDV